MPKGFYSQGVAVLLTERVSIDRIKEILEKDFEITKINNAANEWVFSGPGLVIPFRPEVNGYCTVDIVDRPWPDEMGDPKQETMLFGAWTMGHFGPFTFPGNLQRASQQAWGNPNAKEASETHRAFIRVRVTYVLGKVDSNAPIAPKDYETLPELLFILKLSRSLLALPEALVYFNPSGECLASGDTIDALLERYEQNAIPPLEAIANIRLYNLPQDENWLLMDTVGMMQLDVSDQEAIFHKDAYDPNEVAGFLRNASDYIFQKGPVVKDGDTMDGPGGIRWQGATFENETAPPPRTVLRWFPMDRRKRPHGVQVETAKDKEQQEKIKDESVEKKKGFFNRLFGKRGIN